VAEIPPDFQERALAVLARSARLDQNRLRLDATLEELDVSSLDVISALFDLEHEFGIEIPEGAERLRTVGDVLEAVRARIGASA
jgi:acyl carrier protein